MTPRHALPSLALAALLGAACAERDSQSPQGPEPTVWIGLSEDIGAGAEVDWSYEAWYAHTARPDGIWGYATHATGRFHGGTDQLFDRDAYGSDVLGEGSAADLAGYNDVFARTGAMLDAAFSQARDLGVRTALGTELPGLSRKTLGDRNYPPGEHGQRNRRKSDFGLKLIEKQKLRFNYGMTESQLRRVYLHDRQPHAQEGLCT